MAADEPASTDRGLTRVSESVHVVASLAEVWDLYFEPRLWPAWADGFARVESSDRYPEAGGTLRWRSVSAGRGSVTERVLEHYHRRLHRVAFTDDASEGELVTTFAIETGADGQAGTLVRQELAYRLRERGPVAWLAARLFVRSQLRQSLRRSLERLKREVEEAAASE